MDPGSFTRRDENYYSLVAERRGLLQSDAALVDDSETKAYVKFQAKTYGSTFFKNFGESMVELGRMEVITGHAGKIRKRCGRDD